MLAILLKVAVVCGAVSVRWAGVDAAAASLSDCYLDVPAGAKVSPLIKLINREYTTIHNSLRYSVCICCDLTKSAANVSVRAVPVSGGKQPTVLGRRNCSHLAETDRWLLLQYHGGDNYTHNESCARGFPGDRSTLLLITCGPQDAVTVVQSDNCSVWMELRTPLTCESPAGGIVPGLSHGTVFCILFAAIVGTYLLVGVFYRRLVCGAKGIDQLPNKEFWVNLGHLQADGCNLVCRRGDPPDGHSLSRSDGWQQIAGGSFTDSDRDDAPLQP